MQASTYNIVIFGYYCFFVPFLFLFLLIRDPCAGKSALTFQFVQSVFVCDQDPAIEDHYRKQVCIDDETCLVDVLDTAEGNHCDSPDPLRRSELGGGDGYILCYAIDNARSFENLKDWRDRVLKMKYADHFPMIICGLKCDLEDKRLVTKTEGQEFAKSCNCPFIEVSALNRIHVDEAFFEIVRQIKKDRIGKPQSLPATKMSAKSSGCCFM